MKKYILIQCREFFYVNQESGSGVNLKLDAVDGEIQVGEKKNQVNVTEWIFAWLHLPNPFPVPLLYATTTFLSSTTLVECFLGARPLPWTWTWTWTWTLSGTPAHRVYCTEKRKRKTEDRG